MEAQRIDEHDNSADNEIVPGAQRGVMTASSPVVAVLETALGYAARGWRVVANYTPKADGTCDCHLGASCDSAGKHPRTMHGALDGSTDPAITRRRFTIWPANVGVATGQGLVVLDVDPRNGGEESLERLIAQYGALPRTPTVLTGGGGVHFYFDPGEQLVSSADLKTRGYPGVEVKSAGLQVVAPPSLHPSGRRYEWEAGLSPDDMPLASMPQWLADLAGRKPTLPVGSGAASANGMKLGRAALRFVAEGAPIGSQRLAAVAAARNHLSAGRSVDETVEAIWQGLQRSTWDGDRGAWTEEHARRLVASVATSPPPPLKPLDRPTHKPEPNGTVHSAPPPPAPPPVEPPRTETRAEPPSHRHSELWSAEEFVKLYGDRVRYCGEAGWYVLVDGVWREDRVGQVNRLYKRMPRQWLRDAAKAETDEESKALASWAIKCHTAAKMDSTLRLVQTEARVAITITDFDRDPVLLNVVNGTVNLRTGRLQPHGAEDLLSKQCPVAFDPAAGCPLWERFLSDVFSADEKLVGYVQRLLGFSMTGLQLYHLLVFLWGAGRNGKTTLLEAVSKVLGDYSRSISSELLLMSRENGDYNVAQLRGVRLAITSETGQHRRVDEARVKLLTGGDTLPARHPYGRPFTFTPTHHVWAMSNHKPTIEGQDRGIWSRVKLIEFPNRFELPPEDVDLRSWQPGPHIRLADPALPAKLEREQPGILNWLIRGAVSALRDGLQEPASVSAATEHYREQMDVLGGFLDDCCDVGPYLSDSSARLYGAYKAWCASNGVEPVANNKFGMLLTDRGSFVAVKPTTGDRQRRWSGLQVKGQGGADDAY